MHSEELIHEFAGVITSSPGFRPNALIEADNASVPFAHDMQYFELLKILKLFSNFSTYFPEIKAVSLITLNMELLIFVFVCIIFFLNQQN